MMLKFFKALFTPKSSSVQEVKSPMKGTLSIRVIRSDGTIEHYENAATLS